MTFLDRLKTQYKPGISFFTLEARVYPPKDWPRYYRRGCNGGPPGGRWSFVASLKRYALTVDHDANGNRKVFGEIIDPKERGQT